MFVWLGIPANKKGLALKEVLAPKERGSRNTWAFARQPWAAPACAPSELCPFALSQCFRAEASLSPERGPFLGAGASLLDRYPTSQDSTPENLPFSTEPFLLKLDPTRVFVANLPKTFS